MRLLTSSVRSVLAASLLAGSVLAVQPATASVAVPTLTVGPNVNISKMPGNQSETAVSVNPLNPKNIVVASNIDVGDGLVKAVSMDGGKTWNVQVVADGDNLGTACCDPTMQFDEFGNLFLSYLNANNGNVPIALSTNGGVSFSLLTTIHPTAPIDATAAVAGPTKGASAPLASADQPTLVTGPGSVWVDYNASGTMQAVGAPVNGLGDVGAFHATQDAVGHSAGSFGDIAIGPDGQVLIAYQNPTGGEGPATIYTDLDPDGLGPMGFENTRTFTVTNVGGFDFIPAQAGRSVDAETGLAYDRSGGPRTGRVYILWTSEAPAESDDLDIQVAFSDDDGVTWSTPVQVNDDTGTNSQFNPKLALDQTTGKIAVSFYDARNDLGDHGPGDNNGIPNDDAQMWAAASKDGTSFTPNVQVSAGTSNSDRANNGIDFGDYEGLAFFNGSFYPVWADNSNSTGDNPDGTLRKLDLYVARVRFA
jgi:hypothetical protein